MEAEAITIAAPPAIHLGPIVNPVSNETISIVIPLSAQLATVAKATIDPFIDANNSKSELSSSESSVQVEVFNELNQINTSTIIQPAVTEKSNFAMMIQKADKTKGCPFPTCSRYGRAFSRAHDLKRHIARHETRKERLCEPKPSDVRTCNHCGESFLNDVILQRHMSIHATPTVVVEASSSEGQYFCYVCKEKYPQLSQLSAHIATHSKESRGNVCAFCGIQCENDDILNNHMKEHVSSVEKQEIIETTISPIQVKIEDDGDDFLLEEMLLINKNSRVTSQKTNSISSSTGKIRCDYCSKTFKTKWTLSSHVAAHEGRFQFGCNRCGKKFVRKSHYDGHVRSHDAARPYVCDQCGKTFKELKHRREHTKRKHSGNQIAIQNLLDSISACVAEEASMEQAKLTLLMPMNFTT
ncbi:zinc finger protein 98-like [Chelonus insularis]|uniref:zinc finger protein 98-like n=1 Tax=Chelonus insularis TaxID=460826 RepID=UPI00158BA3D2|nr:zinc finger protein 98-like [Chelonus insularis]XP_034942429.1 zinc finger protein 98-like [Chelonus insularis]